MSAPVWIVLPAVLEIHRQQLAEFGGSPGVRDLGAVESALARPRNLAFGTIDLAAAYTAGLCQNRGFVDGNKRIAFLAGYTFLGLNGVDLEAAHVEVIAAVLSLADHSLDEAGYAAWLRDHVTPRR